MRYPRLVAVVDDDQEMLVSISSLLRSLGIESLPYESAEDFLQAEPTPIDCVIADIHMPGINGLTMLEKLRERGSDVPVIILSALDPEPARAEALARGADAFFAKPVDTEALLRCMTRLVKARH